MVSEGDEGMVRVWGGIGGGIEETEKRGKIGTIYYF